MKLYVFFSNELYFIFLMYQSVVSFLVPSLWGGMLQKIKACVHHSLQGAEHFYENAVSKDNFGIKGQSNTFN